MINKKDLKQAITKKEKELKEVEDYIKLFKGMINKCPYNLYGNLYHYTTNLNKCLLKRLKIKSQLSVLYYHKGDKK